MQRLRKWISHVRGSEVTDSLESRHIPLIVTPLEDDSQALSEKLNLRNGPADKLAEREPVFKKHHEASAIELFYDLFFVANLATFTVNHEIFDGSTFRSYLGFFSLLWATWLQTSLFDVRFAYDSVFQRMCKAVHFGVMMGFVLAGAVYSTSDESADASAFQTLAIVQMISRLTLVIQYASVLWYIKGYPGTRIPLLLIMGVLFAAGMVYLGTYWGFNPATNKTYYAWYITAPIEVVLCIVISSVWRVLSFRHTHLVERVGLLTLIVIGEGILGLSKSVSYLLQASTTITARHAGVLVSSVFLIYFIWMLYFDQIQNNRFGTIKQQVWAVLHYPLHLCILFTVEGSTNLFTWDSVIPEYSDWLRKYPFNNDGTYRQDFVSKESVVAYANSSLKELSTHFNKDKQIYKYYDYYTNITALENINASFTSESYYNQSLQVITIMWQGVGNAIFEVFGVTPPEKSEIQPASELRSRYDDYINFIEIYEVVFQYFYIAAGLFLVVLSLMYVIGNKRKTICEYIAIGVRIIIAAGITMTLVGISYNNDIATTTRFLVSPWHVIIVMLCYLLVILVDNFLVELAIHKRRQNGTLDPERQKPFQRQTTQIFYSRANGSDSEDTTYHGHDTTTEIERAKYTLPPI